LFYVIWRTQESIRPAPSSKNFFCFASGRKRLRNDLVCVEWCVKPQRVQLISPAAAALRIVSRTIESDGRNVTQSWMIGSTPGLSQRVLTDAPIRRLCIHRGQDIRAGRNRRHPVDSLLPARRYTGAGTSYSPQSCPWVHFVGGSVAELLACWTQAQKGPGSNRSRDAIG